MNPSNACPTFFRASILEARRTSYKWAGYTLARHLNSLVDEDDDNEAEADALFDALDNDQPDQVWHWLKRHLPRAMRLVPTRRRTTFLEGVLSAHEDGLVEVWC
jgi:hypothetical protein